MEKSPIFTYGLCASYPDLKGDRLALERLNRYICRLVCNDYRSPYEDLLGRLNRRPLFQEVTHRRILLSHRYYNAVRHLPHGTLQNENRNPRLRLRSHRKSMAVWPPTTPYQTTPSALEQTVGLWNRLPEGLASASFSSLKSTLSSENYHDRSEQYRDMQQAIRLL